MKDGNNKKLSNADVRQIKGELKTGTKTQQELANEYKVSQSTISDIKTRDTHKQVK